MEISKIRYHKHSDGIHIHLGNTLRKRVRTLFLIQSVIYFALGIGLIIFVFVQENPNGSEIFFYTSFFLISMVVFFRYFDRATTKEELHITPNLLSLIEKSFFRYSAKQFDVSKISSFG